MFHAGGYFGVEQVIFSFLNSDLIENDLPVHVTCGKETQIRKYRLMHITCVYLRHRFPYGGNFEEPQNLYQYTSTVVQFDFISSALFPWPYYTVREIVLFNVHCLHVWNFRQFSG